MAHSRRKYNENFDKKRWLGKILLQILQKEYSVGDDEHIRLLAKNGRFQLNMEVISEDDLETRKLKDGDLFSSKEHRHEPPIIEQQPSVIHEDDKFYVIDKPSSYPIHPVSQYRHNSLIFILAREFKADYHVVHRLDRLTSGLVIMAKTKAQSQILGKQITKRQLTKVSSPQKKWR